MKGCLLGGLGTLENLNVKFDRRDRVPREFEKSRMIECLDG
jgi:hypothetical protein